MWFRLFATLIYLSLAVVGQDMPGPGEPAPTFADGAFTEPRGEQSTYTLGSSINITWDTTYETANLWLIVDWSYDKPIQLASNIAQRWYQWQVATSSHNSSQIYAFRLVNATGTASEQSDGGFTSAAFWIQLTASVPASSATSSASLISTSASAPATISATTTSPAATSQTTDSSSDGQAQGLTDSAKVGVGVGVGVGGVGLIALAAGILLYRRSRNNKTQATDNMEPYSQGTPSTAPGSLYYGNYYKQPAEMQDTGRKPELDAPGFYPTARDPAELSG
ncbi:hypothetical protein F4805DRAFT_447970 [Annulohypoxylon moriforme]|nr:hypothetical protein F4805DRAFT_447970 [Annulohypoxylon moriforme]